MPIVLQKPLTGSSVSCVTVVMKLIYDIRWSNKCSAAMRNICETKHHVPGMTDRIITGSRAAIVNFIQARVALLYHLSTEEARRKK